MPARSDVPAGREKEFIAEFRESFRALWLTAVGIVGDAALADDIVQEAAVVALNKLDQFRQGTSFKAWAGQIVRNVAMNRARSERRRRFASLGPALDENRPPLRLVTPEPSDQPEPGEVFDGRILAALGDVAELPRACLLLRTVEGLAYPEIASLLGIPEGTAMSHVHRTRQMLRSKLAEFWNERTKQAGSDVG
jgi:RNA polymerase sigma-70 factor (ECF subfamily)